MHAQVQECVVRELCARQKKSCKRSGALNRRLWVRRGTEKRHAVDAKGKKKSKAQEKLECYEGRKTKNSVANVRYSSRERKREEMEAGICG